MAIKRFKTLGLIVFNMLMLSFLSTAQAEFKRDYTVAKKSFEDGEYQDAIKKLKSAIADNPESAARVKLYGMRFDSYLPHYFLGQSYFRLGDCAAAISAWNQAINAGVIQEQDEFAQMESDLRDCNTQGIDITAIAQQANDDIDSLDDAIVRYSGLQNESLLAREWAATWQPDLSLAQQLATTLRQRLTVATNDIEPDAIKAISNEAQQGAIALNGREGLARAQVAAIQAESAENKRLALEDARRGLQNSIRTAQAVDKPQGGSTQMSTLLTDLNNQIAFGENLGSTAPELNIREQTQIIDNVLRRYNVAVQDWNAQQQSIAQRTPPPDLKKIAEAFFSGDYETAARLADPEEFSEDRARIQALLFRAAANHKLYVRNGEQQSSTLSQVQSDIRAIKRMNSGFSPYIAAFSPSFLSLFRQSG